MTTSGNTQLRTIAGATGGEEAGSFPALLHRFKGEIARALPKHINPDRMARVALTCFRQTPDLAKCDPAGVFAAVIQASQLGLEPGLNGRAFLIPYYNTRKSRHECQFVPGWKGLVELANRTGRAAVWTGAVFKGDSYNYQLGDSPFAHHIPRGEDDPELLEHVYAIGRIKGNDWPVIESWPVAKVRKHRDRYNKQGTKHYSYREWEMYARKIPLLQVLKYLPSSPELETAIAMSEAADAGESQGLTIDGALSGDYAPPAPQRDDDDTPPQGVDRETGEIIPPEGTPAGLQRAVADIKSAIERATTVEQVDLQRDMSRNVRDTAMRAELEAAATAKLKELGQASGA